MNAGRPNHEDTVLAPRLALIYRTVRGHGTGERRPRRKGGRVPAEITYHTKLLTPVAARFASTCSVSVDLLLFRSANAAACLRVNLFQAGTPSSGESSQHNYRVFGCWSGGLEPLQSRF